jgi:dTDP-4-amino-4,6-dideoxygalactose transaminase
MIGVNSRLDTIQAAILRVNLRNLDDFIARRQAAAAYYSDRLGDHAAIRVPKAAVTGTHIWHQYTILLDPGIRNRVQAGMKEAGIPTMIYYPVALSLQQAFAFAGYREGDFPVTEHLCRSVLSLPIHTEMDEGQLDPICTTLMKVIDNER